MAYRSDSISSLGGADGVPVKIGEKCQPPRKVSLPSGFKPVNPSDVLFMEYDFSLERKVIEWAEAQRETQEAMEKAATEHMAESIEQFAKEPMTDSESNISAVATSEGTEQSMNGVNQSPPAAQTANNAVIHQMAPQPQPFYNIGSSMLTPTQVAGPNTLPHQQLMLPAQNKPKNQSLIDLKDFENEQDPFENLELKTLNDMEELNKVLQGSQPAEVAEERNGTPQDGTPAVPAAEASDDPPAQPHRDLKDVDYPEIDSLSLEDVSMGDYDTVPKTVVPPVGVNYTQSTMIGQHYSTETGSVNYDMYNRQTPLPPIPNSNQYLVQQQQTDTSTFLGQNKNNSNQAPVSSAALSSTNPFAKTTFSNTNPFAKKTAFSSSNPFANMPWKDTEPTGSSILFNRGSVHYTPNGIVNQNRDSSPSRGSGKDTPPINPLRSASSTPDISGSGDRKFPASLPTSHTPPPYKSRGSQNASPPARPSTQQDDSENWNPYSILPPTPSGHRQSPEIKAASNSPKLPDPFNSLSIEAQRFANNISDMGFPRARVARAVEKLGQDDKKVIDHLVTVNKLADEGHNTEDAETSLHLFQQSGEKAEQFLKLLGQFKELGFPHTKIESALLDSDLNENKALDILTSS